VSHNQRTGTPETSRRLAVLAFHKIGAPPPGCSSTWFYISERIFESFLRLLQKNSWQVIDAEAFLRGLDFPDSLPERAALLTFDDGYRSMRQIALPLLRSFGFPSVHFVPVSYIGSTNHFDVDLEPEEPICGWDDLKEMRCGKVSIQSHGVAHRRLSTLDDTELRYELEHSKKIIESRIGHAVKMFSFPYGDNGRDPRVTAAVLREAGYSAAFLYGGGPNVIPCRDRFGLRRLAMGPDTDLAGLLSRSWPARSKSVR
jgi:peptidoglycan/xylan/chitin deacetylase (PgdA/CDA1 family)